jgi:hypothetical protein
MPIRRVCIIQPNYTKKNDEYQSFNYLSNKVAFMIRQQLRLQINKLWSLSSYIIFKSIKKHQSRKRGPDSLPMRLRQSLRVHKKTIMKTIINPVFSTPRFLLPMLQCASAALRWCFAGDQKFLCYFLFKRKSELFIIS